MEDLLQLYEITETAPRNLEKLTDEWLEKLRVILWGQSAVPAATNDVIKDLTTASPQQTKKRVKRLSSLNEEDAEEPVEPLNASNDKLTKPRNISSPKSKRSNAELLAFAETIGSPEEAADEDVIPRKKSFEGETEPTKQRKSEATNLMPPPPAPAAITATEDSHIGRPQRAAKLKSEKSLKEPKLNLKMRRPVDEAVKIKLEHEQRASQMHEKIIKAPATLTETSSNASISSAKSNDSVVILPRKKVAPLEISSNSDDDEVVQPSIDPISKKKASNWRITKGDTTRERSESGVRNLRIKIKREKVSIQSQDQKQYTSPPNDTTFKAPDAVPPPMPTTKSKNSTFEETSMASSILSSTTNTSSATGKKPRKKKDAPPHRPIKVERFSILDAKPSPIASRTRQGSTGKETSHHENEAATSPPEQTIAEEFRRPGSIYEDAVETPTSINSKATVINDTVNFGPGPAVDATINLGPGSAVDATINLGLCSAVDATINLGPGSAVDATINLGPVSDDVTFCTNPAQTTFQVAQGQTTFVLDSGNPNATVTLNKDSRSLGDATFDIHSSSKNEKEDVAGQRSFETAKDSSVPHDDSLITEDESSGPPPSVPGKQKAASLAKLLPVTASASGKANSSAKAGYKMTTRTNELFNPLAQSPVKMRVEAFENAAAAAATEQIRRPLRTKKENVTPTNVVTPVIGKLPAPSLGRFLTPTQSSNLSSVGSAYVKKVPTSASKAVPLTKSGSSNIQRSNSISISKTLQRENSADDFRKGLHNLAEERKRQREQKHLLAAQQREAKERERAERMAKLAKEREEKRMQKQQEQLEQKKREMEEIQRKLRLQQEEEAAKIKAARERDMLMIVKQQQQQMAARQKMMPPPPKSASKYTFEMLHEDDSTDDEDKVSYKRPPPPSWSRSHKRGLNVLKQEYTPSSYIDSFFSVQPMTPDLKLIFPNIDARHLKRNSSVLWSTPPRYSELPKY